MSEQETILPILTRFAEAKKVEITTKVFPAKGSSLANTQTPGYTLVTIGSFFFEFTLDGQLSEAYAYDEC